MFSAMDMNAAALSQNVEVVSLKLARSYRSKEFFRTRSARARQNAASSRGYAAARTTFLYGVPMSSLVTTDWLHAQLGAADLVVFDATYYLPTEAGDAQQNFIDARVPGARFFDLDELADQDTDLPHMIPTAGRFERIVGELGVEAHSRVVFYDQKGMFSAARGWWMMKLFGHEQVFVLDGGLPKWRGEGLRTERGSATPRVAPQDGATRFRASLRASLLRGTGDLLDNLASAREQVIDARARARFEGTAPEPRAGVASGHIPGSVNLPFTTLLNADQTFKDASELRALFAGLGSSEATQLVASCGTGVTATVVALGAELAGWPPVAVYDGSWTEWGSRTDTPKRQG
jgi:thiosulfate/3-mercaptopyruvate sulfurtransferase